MFDIDNIKSKIVGLFALFTKKTLELEWIEDLTIPTCQTNGVELRYNSEFLATRTPKDQLFIILHEIVHCWGAHPVRFADAKWIDEYKQQACDYAANSILVAAGLEVPHDALFKFAWRNMGAEEIYHILAKGQQPEPRGGKGRGRFDNHPDLQPDEDGNEPSEAKKEQLEKEAVRDQLESVATARMCGKLSEEMERILGELTAPKEDWRELLAEYLVVSSSKDDFTFTKPNRRYNDGLIMPDMFSEKPPSMVLAGDTSGSITKKQSQEMASEVIGLVEEVEPEELHVIWCDSRVRSVQVFDDMENPELKPKGGGGTNFRPPFKYCDENGIDPELLIYMTDGYCSSFPDPPPYDVLWLVWQDRHEFKPPFGDVIVMHGLTF